MVSAAGIIQVLTLGGDADEASEGGQAGACVGAE
jgi:hypothetical protein